MIGLKALALIAALTFVLAQDDLDVLAERNIPNPYETTSSKPSCDCPPCPSSINLGKNMKVGSILPETPNWILMDEWGVEMRRDLPAPVEAEETGGTLLPQATLTAESEGTVTLPSYIAPTAGSETVTTLPPPAVWPPANIQFADTFREKIMEPMPVPGDSVDGLVPREIVCVDEEQHLMERDECWKAPPHKTDWPKTLKISVPANKHCTKARIITRKCKQLTPSIWPAGQPTMVKFNDDTPTPESTPESTTWYSVDPAYHVHSTTSEPTEDIIIQDEYETLRQPSTLRTTTKPKPCCQEHPVPATPSTIAATSCQMCSAAPAMTISVTLTPSIRYGTSTIIETVQSSGWISVDPVWHTNHDGAWKSKTITISPVATSTQLQTPTVSSPSLALATTTHSASSIVVILTPTTSSTLVSSISSPSNTQPKCSRSRTRKCSKGYTRYITGCRTIRPTSSTLHITSASFSVRSSASTSSLSSSRLSTASYSPSRTPTSSNPISSVLVSISSTASSHTSSTAIRLSLTVVSSSIHPSSSSVSTGAPPSKSRHPSSSTAPSSSTRFSSSVVTSHISSSVSRQASSSSQLSSSSGSQSSYTSPSASVSSSIHPPSKSRTKSSISQSSTRPSSTISSLSISQSPSRISSSAASSSRFTSSAVPPASSRSTSSMQPSSGQPAISSAHSSSGRAPRKSHSPSGTASCQAAGSTGAFCGASTSRPKASLTTITTSCDLSASSMPAIRMTTIMAVCGNGSSSTPQIGATTITTVCSELVTTVQQSCGLVTKTVITSYCGTQGNATTITQACAMETVTAPTPATYTRTGPAVSITSFGLEGSAPSSASVATSRSVAEFPPSTRLASSVASITFVDLFWLLSFVAVVCFILG